ncbi:MAG: hypothetical protein BMS9Abin31_0452 [Gammaproteobacteria bacterium]|nr:MAG: hypothetical protein BMS9Abin31_0452 [Gammaproteobacteria bacterium]
MQIKLIQDDFEPLTELQEYQQQLLHLHGKYGAMANFIGTMRDYNEDKKTTKMFLEHYPGMTEKQLEKIANEATTKWPILDCMVLHRVGMIKPNDAIVLVAVWSAHRAAAFDACRFIMEQLKTRAPFWKRETTASGKHWVEKNTPE